MNRNAQLLFPLELPETRDLEKSWLWSAGIHVPRVSPKEVDLSDGNWFCLQSSVHRFVAADGQQERDAACAELGEMVERAYKQGRVQKMADPTVVCIKDKDFNVFMLYAYAWLWGW